MLRLKSSNECKPSAHQDAGGYSGIRQDDTHSTLPWRMGISTTVQSESLFDRLSSGCVQEFDMDPGQARAVALALRPGAMAALGNSPHQINASVHRTRSNLCRLARIDSVMRGTPSSCVPDGPSAWRGPSVICPPEARRRSLRDSRFAKPLSSGALRRAPTLPSPSGRA